MRRILMTTAAGLSLLVTPALAETEVSEEKAADGSEMAEEKAVDGSEKAAEKSADGSEVAAEKSARERALDAILLPDQADDLRRGGMKNEEVVEALEVLEEKGATASEAREVLDAGETDGDGDAWEGNFGSWVRAQVEDGKRGKELSEAVRAEKETRRERKRAMKEAGTWTGGGDEDGEDGEKPEHAGKDGERGKSGEHGKPENAGKEMGAEKKAAGKEMGAEKKAAGEEMGAEKKAAGQAKSEEKRGGKPEGERGSKGKGK